jgi:hypothetical protein
MAASRRKSRSQRRPIPPPPQTAGLWRVSSLQKIAGGDLSIISFDTGEIVRQFDLFLEYDLPFLKWTPDGKAITYEISRNGVSNIWKQAVTGGAPEQVTNWDSDVIFRFDWSRDGRLAVERGMFTSDIVLIRAEE